VSISPSRAWKPRSHANLGRITTSSGSFGFTTKIGKPGAFNSRLRCRAKGRSQGFFNSTVRFAHITAARKQKQRLRAVILPTMFNKKTLIILSLSILLCGCSKKIEGEVFIVTNERGTVKLSMTPIGIIDQSEYDKLNEFAESEKGKISRIEKELNNLEGERSEITTRKEQLKKQGEISDALYRRTLKLRFDYFDEVRAGAAENKSLDSELKAMLDKSHADATALEAEVKVLEDRISQIEKRSQDLKNSIIASKLNLSNRIGEEVRKSTNTETNSDGAYSMSIPSPDVFLVAAAERSLGGEIEYYGWLLKADSGRLVLNNGNLFYSWSIPKE
jgi:hypothetical protein